MKENSKCFVLVYSSLLLKRDVLELIGLKGEKEVGKLLI